MLSPRMRVTGWRSKVLADEKRLGDALGLGLDGVLEPDPPGGPVPQQLLESGQVVGGGDQEDVPDAGLHEGGQRVVDHRLVVDRLQLLGGHSGDRDRAG
jgi:hypothetical protein